MWSLNTGGHKSRFHCIAIPILVDFLPIDYVYHLNLLVKSMHILLSSSIHSNALLKARDMLATFYRTIPCLYPDELCTIV